MTTTLDQIWSCMQEKLAVDKRVRIQEIYQLVEDHIALQPDDFEPDAPGSNSPKWQRNVRNVLQHRKEQGDIIWFGGGEYLIPSVKDFVNIELSHRFRLWHNLKQSNEAENLDPSLLRELRIYGGAQGIWVDKARTELISETGITVSVLHTGATYKDDLLEDKVIYHYPKTNRPQNRDLSEINSTKAAARLGIPVFVITTSETNSSKRVVRLGWVISWSDDEETFEITFSDIHPSDTKNISNWIVLEDEIPDAPKYSEGATRKVFVNAYERSTQARDDCLTHYGFKCSICGFDFEENYGEVGKGFIHVHHIKPLSEIREDYQISPVEDLRPVCPNCHAVIHKRKPAYTIEEVKRFLK